MRSLTVAVTVIAVLAHATLGCCALEGHAGVRLACGHHHEFADAVDHCSHATPAPARDCPDHAPHECCRTKCHWPAPEAGGAAETIRALLAATPALAAGGCPVACDHSCSRRLVESHESCARPALPVRLHVAIGVFLI